MAMPTADIILLVFILFMSAVGVAMTMFRALHIFLKKHFIVFTI